MLIEELLKDEAFVDKFAKAETCEERKELLSENGIELTLNEVSDLCEFAVAVSESETDGELSPSALEMVAGGRCGFFHGLYDGATNNGKNGWGLFYHLGKAIGRSSMEKDYLGGFRS